MTRKAAGVRGDESSLVGRLTLEQKVHLLTGADGWTLHGAAAIGLRSMVVSDGPAGVRGTRFDPADPSTSLPCPVALGATWDPELIERLTAALAREARSKGIDVILGPTVNIIRTPLSGRGFECFSEDPALTTAIAVAYVRGVQSEGLGATVKHFVGNDSETERRTYDAEIADDVLRELYLPPFEACVDEGVLLVMAAYNSVNGAAMTANRPLLRDLLKSEWGFRGVVVSDWSATDTTAASARAGLDLIMPGPHGPWGNELVAAVRRGDVDEAEVDDKVARILHVARAVGALDGDIRSTNPAAMERDLIDPALVREVTARSLVLLSNHRGLLPLKAANVRTVALIGPNAIEPQTQGGGSIRVLPPVRADLARALREALPQTTVTVHQGCVTSSTVAAPREGTLRDPVTGRHGFRLEIRTAAGDTVFDAPFPGSAATWWDGLPDAVHEPGSRVTMRAAYKPDVDGPHVIGAAGVGALRVAIGGSVVAEATTLLPGEVVEALSRPPEVRVAVDLEVGRDVDVEIQFVPDQRFVTLRLGIAPMLGDDELIDEAARAAEESDIAIVVVGSAEGAESEGYDRATLSLAGRQDELVTRIVAANPNTVVVVNAGMPVLMPWIDHAATVVHAWLPGQGFGDGLAAALLGVIEPGGRLPLSMPRAEQDAPVLHAKPDAGALVYGEGLLVGYRGYDHSGTEPLFPFGHGLGYTEWTYESVAVEGEPVGGVVRVAVTVRNSGARAGREVVQLYLEAPVGDASRPLRTLAAFAVVEAKAGAQAEARLVIPARAFARFVPPDGGWGTVRGVHILRIGRSSRDLRLSTSVEIR